MDVSSIRLKRYLLVPRRFGMDFWRPPFLSFWNKTAGVFGALGGIASFVGTTTIIPFMPDGWAASAGGFPAMTEKVAFVMKDFVLLAASLYLLKQDLLRLSLSTGQPLSPEVPAELRKESHRVGMQS